MKKLIAIAFAVVFFVCSASAGEKNTNATNTSLFKKTIYNEGSSIPTFIEFKSSQNISLEKFESILLSFLSGNEWSIQEEKRTTDQLGFTHITFNQYFNGRKIDLTKYHVHVKEGKVVKANGNFVSNMSIQNIPTYTENAALAIAKSKIGASVYKWELPDEERHIKIESNNPNASYYPNGELMYLPTGVDFNEQLKLCWKFNIYAHQPLSRQIMYIDATNGNILLKNDLIHHTDVQGTAVTGYSGVQQITTDSVGPGQYRLRETTRGNGVITLNLNNATTYGNAVDFTDTDNYWNNVNAQQDEIATDAHWGAEVTYDYYDSIHNRNSIDGNGFTLYSYVHFDNNYANAFWDGQRMTYGDGDGNISALTALDIAGHEVSHGLTNFTADLIYQNESGALNESFSDIFGTAIEFFGKPSVANWNIGEDIGAAFRSMSSPNLFGDPDTYQGTNWYTGTADNGGVHTNSGVQNKWFYILSQGESGVNDHGDAYNVTGLGIIEASKIAFRNLTVYLTPSSNHNEARFYAIQSAIDIYGPCSPEVKATTDAWYAVGVGQPYVPYVLSDFTPSAPTACVAPLSVAFLNTSVNGINFTWDFGDGGNSTDVHPQHTYTSNGVYNVTLIADGGTCGIDTIEIDSAIQIGPDVPCNVVLPSNGTVAQQTSCLGKIFDSGGATGNYSDNENSFVTIAPLGANTITLTFPNFDIEPGSGNTCDYDYIEIFDGPTTNSTSLGKFCNTTGNPGTIVSTGGAITIEFSSDGGLNLSGFEIDWACSYPNVAPTADFSVNSNESCTGTINFTDESLFGPTSWSWDFGDGNTSTLQNPSHTYSQNGTYTVTLTASNSFGNNSVTKSSIITVNKPSAPSTQGASYACLNQADTIFSSSTGITRWYDGSGNVILHEGDSLINPNVTGDMTYYIENLVKQPVQKVGPQNNTFGGGGNFNNYQFLYFDAHQEIVIQSVLVYSGTDANRVIELRDNQGQLIEAKTVFIPSGEQRVQLEFSVLPGVDYQLGLSQTSVYELYRNNSGTNYPYSVNGLASITRSSANTNPLGFYYFFYDWEVREKDCISDKIKLDVKAIDCSTGIDDLKANENIIAYPNPVRNELTIELVDNTEDVMVDLLDITGKKVIATRLIDKSINNFNINMSDLSNGIYTFRLTKQSSTYNQLIIKK